MGMQGKKAKNEKGKTGVGEEMGKRGKERARGEGICWTNVKLLPTRL